MSRPASSRESAPRRAAGPASHTGRTTRPARAPALVLRFALATVLLAGCAGAPPVPPRQVLEYERHTSVGLEKHADGYLGQARAAFRRALAHAELDDSGGRIAGALINLGGTELLLDEAEAAGRAYARAIREARAVADPGLEWLATGGLAEATRRLGQPGKALELYAARPDPGKPLPDALTLAAEIGRARALADAGRRDEARAVLDRVEVAARKLPPPAGALAATHHARARILFAEGRHEEALASAQHALDADRSLHHPPSVADDHRLLAEIHAVLGRTEAAATHRERAAAIYRHTGQAARLRAVQPDSGRP